MSLRAEILSNTPTSSSQNTKPSPESTQLCRSIDLDGIRSTTEVGAAKLFADFGGLPSPVAYIVGLDRWAWYDGSLWHVDDLGVRRYVHDWADSRLRAYLDGDNVTPSQTKAQLSIYRRIMSKHGTDNILSEARSLLVVESQYLDANPWLLGTAAGVVDLRTGQLSAGERHEYVTKSIGYRIADKGACPKFARFLDQIFCGDAELIEYVWRAIAYSLTASTKEQCLFICYGSGSNGKSTLFSVLNALLGEDYCMSSASETLMQRQQTGGIPNDIAALRGKRLLLSQESAANRKLDEALVKQLTGGDKITARYLHKEFFTFAPVCKIWLASNHRPSIDGGDHGIWRRIHLIPFHARISAEERNENLTAELLEELPCILRTAVSFVADWLDVGLHPPASVMSATEDYRSDMDTISTIVDETLRKGSDTDEVLLTSAYEAYQHWTIVHGIKQPWTHRAYVSQLRDGGYEICKRRDGRVLVGYQRRI